MPADCVASRMSVAPTERASSTSPAGSSRCPVAYWTWLTQMTEVRSSTAAAIVSSENEAGSWRAGARRTSTPVSRASRSQGYVTLGNSRSAETTFSPSPGFSHQATWQSASVACVTTATSSGLAPRSRAAAALRDVADPLLDLVVEPDRPAAGDLAPERLAGVLHRQRLEPVSSPCSGRRPPRARGSRCAARGRGARSRLGRSVDLELEDVGPVVVPGRVEALALLVQARGVELRVEDPLLVVERAGEVGAVRRRGSRCRPGR